MLQLAVCDDHASELNHICNLLLDYIHQVPSADIAIHRFQSPTELLEYIQAQHSFDAYLLDILMPDIDGITLGEVIRNYDDEAVLIYLTTSADYAVESYTVQALHYLLKPIEREQFFPVINRMIRQVETKKSDHFIIKTKQGYLPIRFHELMYIDCHGHLFFYHLINGTTLESMVQRKSFDESHNFLLESGNFIKISSSFIVNMQYIHRLTRSELELTNETILPISRMFFIGVKKKYFDFLLARGRI